MSLRTGVRGPKGAPFAGRGATRERCPAPAFGRSRAWRTLGRRGVAIRSPRRETWQLGNTLGEFAPTLPGCHCEPVRTLVWQSVLPAGKPGKLALLRANPYALSRIRLRRCSLLCAAAGVTDCHVASLLAMTCKNLPPVRTIPGHCRCTAGKRPYNRRRVAVFSMSLRTSAHTGAAIRVPLPTVSVAKTALHPQAVSILCMSS